jgi:hypothetical protein
MGRRRSQSMNWNEKCPIWKFPASSSSCEPNADTAHQQRRCSQVRNRTSWWRRRGRISNYQSCSADREAVHQSISEPCTSSSTMCWWTFFDP